MAAAILIILAGLLAYANSFAAPFLLDDELRIINNPHLHQLWPLGPLLSSTSRPLVNLTLALNYQWSRLDVGSYHAVNLAIHLLAAGVVYGLLWRLLRSKGLGLAVALVWVVHPLTTQAVTYVIQRAESLMGLWYLLTLYALLRAAATVPRSHWLILSILACWAGMATKPVMVTAPLLALFLDRTFLAGSFRQAWRLRKSYYLFLFASWILLAYLLVTGVKDFGDTAGLDIPKITLAQYASTQPAVILHYLRLALWPRPLVFDYGWEPASTWQEILVPALGLTAVLAVGVYIWRRNPRIGFWVWWVVLILAPTSSIIPIADLAFEYRMYLPLVGVAVFVTLSVHAGLHRLLAADRVRRVFAGVLVLIAAGGYGTLTAWRNRDYRTEIGMWRDTAAKRPDSIRALSNLGASLVGEGKSEEAMQYLSQVLARKPDHLKAVVNMGSALVLAQNNRMEEAVRYFQEALRLNPNSPEAHHNLGTALAKQDKLEEALEHYRQAARLRPNFAEAYYNIGRVLAQQGRFADAEANYRTAVRHDPRSLDAWYNLANTLIQLNKAAEAVDAYSEVIRMAPRSLEAHEAHNNLGNAWFRQGKLEEAIRAYGAALQLKPDSAQTHNNIGTVLASVGRVEDAIAHFTDALRLHPDYAEAHNNLGNALGARDRLEEAITHYQRAIALKPDYADARNNLGVALARAGRLSEAAEELGHALRLRPDYPQARENLAAIQQQLQAQAAPMTSDAQ